MRAQLSSRRANTRGFALMMTLLTIAVALVIFASILSWAFGSSTITQRNNQYNMSENAAEAAVETVIGQLDHDFIYSSISNAAVYTGLPASIVQSNWPVQYIFTDTNGNAGMASVVIQTTSSSTVTIGSQYTGLSGLVQSNDVYVTATPVGQPYTVPATVHESMQFAVIPLFQFAIFYNINLEIAPGSAMTVSGPVFCNQSIWEGSGQCTFSSRVTAVGTNCQNASDPFALNYAPQTPPATFSLPGQPTSHASSLLMPIGTNNDPNAVLGVLNLPPSPYNMGTSQAYNTSNGISYMANEADLYITNYAFGTNDGLLTPTGTNLAVFFQDQQNLSTPLTQMLYDFFIMTNRTTHSLYTTNFVPAAAVPNIVFAGMSWITNAVFYDWREGWNNGSGPGKRVEAVQIDVGKLNSWLTNTVMPYWSNGVAYDTIKWTHASHHIGGIYVYTSVPLTGTQLPAVRVCNAAQLPSITNNSTYGLTIATPFPMYVWKDYNSQNNGLSALGLYGAGATANTLPSALLADSVTVLSDSWSDSTTTRQPNASSTTINAGMLEGIVPSNPNISGNYSGGVENFMRLLENWSGNNTLTYNGSIVVLFPSQYATNSWVSPSSSGYYQVPTRHWSFDFNFEVPSKLPPMTPSSRAIVRGNWYAHQ